MIEKDLVFLNNFINFTYMNHYVTAMSLLNSAINPESVAIDVHEKLEMIQRNEAVKISENLSSFIRIQKVVIARLYAEYVSSMEDFGAFLWSIANRGQGIEKSIVSNYLKSQHEVSKFFDKVLECPGKSLGEILKLPSTDLIQDKSLRKDLINHFSELAEKIREIAKQYRDVSENFQTTNTEVSFPSDYLYLLTRMNDNTKPTTKNNPSKNGVAVKALNKIKHRFMLIENFKEFVHARPINNDIEYCIQPTTPEWAKKLIDNITVITQISVEIASMLILLEKNGLNI